MKTAPYGELCRNLLPGEIARRAGHCDPNNALYENYIYFKGCLSCCGEVEMTWDQQPGQPCYRHGCTGQPDPRGPRPTQLELL